MKTDMDMVREVKRWVKRDFDIDLEADEIGFADGAVWVDFRDYDLNKYGDYHDCEYIETCVLGSDGRSEYLQIRAELRASDYFVD